MVTCDGAFNVSKKLLVANHHFFVVTLKIVRKLENVLGTYKCRWLKQAKTLQSARQCRSKNSSARQAFRFSSIFSRSLHICTCEKLLFQIILLFDLSHNFPLFFTQHDFDSVKIIVVQEKN